MELVSLANKMQSSVPPGFRWKPADAELWWTTRCFVHLTCLPRRRTKVGQSWVLDIVASYQQRANLVSDLNYTSTSCRFHFHWIHLRVSVWWWSSPRLNFCLQCRMMQPTGLKLCSWPLHAAGSSFVGPALGFAPIFRELEIKRLNLNSVFLPRSHSF